MATIQKIKKENIEKARQLLLCALYLGDREEHVRQREAMRELLGPITAIRHSGKSFEEISDLLRQAGIQLSAATVRTYYFELKTERELAKEAQTHADKILKTRETIKNRLREQQQELDERVVLERAHAQRINAPLEATPNTPALAIAVDKQEPGSRRQENQQARSPTAHVEKQHAQTPAVFVPANPGQAEELSKIDREEKTADAARPTPPTSAAAVSASSPRLPLSASYRPSAQALTLDEIEALSTNTTEIPELIEDVVLRDGRVYYASGRPYEGVLTKKQVFLLRTSGRLVGKTIGRTSKSFVKMPLKL